ncbi:MAG: hypothetical protein AcusKO_29360 [Acuticoccus sp.]
MRCGFFEDRIEIWRQLSEQTCRIDTVAKVIRYGLEGEGVEANEAARLVTRYALRPPFADNLETAQTIYGAALSTFRGSGPGKSRGRRGDGSHRLPVARMIANGVAMGVKPRDIARMSLAEWVAFSEGWHEVHGSHAGKPPAPSDEEFHEMILKRRDR